jgi:hypothetical protein
MDAYVFAMILERMKGEQPSNDKKIDQLAKQQAAEGAVPIVAAMRSSKTKSLPSKSYCRMFFENYPNMHMWVAASQSRDFVEYSEGVALSVPDGAVVEDWAEFVSSLGSSLQGVCALIAMSKFTKAFQKLAEIPDYVVVAAVAEQRCDSDLSLRSAACMQAPLWDLLALHAELVGAELHLKSNVADAATHYVRATQYGSRPRAVAGDSPCLSVLCSNLKLISIKAELGDRDEV